MGFALSPSAKCAGHANPALLAAGQGVGVCHRQTRSNSRLAQSKSLNHTAGAFTLEVHLENNLHLVIDEVERWRTIIGNDFIRYKYERQKTGVS